MNPSSSDSEKGFANSARRSDVVCGDEDFGIYERNSPVREDGSRFILGLGGLTSSASPIQQKSARLLRGGFGRGFCGTDFRFRSSISSNPNRSTNVSVLVLSRIVAGDFCGLNCSLCCQQYPVGLGDLEIALRHGLPFDVRPLHVDAGFFESKRGRRDSGVFGIKGILRC